MMRRQDFVVGIRVIFTDPDEFVSENPTCPNVFGLVGTVRAINGDIFEITWDDEEVNKTIRGWGTWSFEHFEDMFDFASPEEEKRTAEFRRVQQEQMADQKRRQEHAMKYL